MTSLTIRHGVGASVLALSSVCAAAQTPQPRAPIAANVERSSLYRAHAGWIVTTTIFLSAGDEEAIDAGTPRTYTFRLLNPDALKDPDGTPRLVCADLDKPLAQLAIQCEYHPPIDFTGDDIFHYDVEKIVGATEPKQHARSGPGTVTIDVKNQGLRWEFVTNADSSLSSDTPTRAQGLQDTIPSILGRTTQDFMVGLDWVVAHPRASPTSDFTDLKMTRSAHFAFRTGLQTKPEAVKATPIATTRAAPLVGARTESALAPQRKFTAGGEFNYNAVFPSNAMGTFLEIGALFRGHFDASVEGEDNNQEVAGQILRLVRTGDGVGSFRGEVGFRVTLKQYHEGTFATRVQRATGDKHVEFQRNSDDFVAIEAGYLRNSALSGIEDIGIRENRYFVRAMALPELKGIKGHPKAILGVELTGGKDQAKQVRILYGLNLTAIGLGQ